MSTLSTVKGGGALAREVEAARREESGECVAVVEEAELGDREEAKMWKRIMSVHNDTV